MELEEYLDHTILYPDSTEEQVKKVCDEAKEYNFASVCVNPFYASFVREELKGTDVKTCVVVGFPLGADLKEVKAQEAKEVVEAGAEEVDMVINIGALKDGRYDYVREDIEGVVNAVPEEVVVKVIIETCLLSEKEKVKACELAEEAGADFVKTSTGFSDAGAKLEDVKLMRETVGEEMGVKAAGGIKTRKDAEAMIEAGATRIGASSSVQIVES
ncbi:MAG: deoxyribose-phosphate aldolase [Candidatus Natronoplasma sp.]